MGFDGVTNSISIAQAHALPESEFRDQFCDAINELVGAGRTRGYAGRTRGYEVWKRVFAGIKQIVCMPCPASG